MPNSETSLPNNYIQKNNAEKPDSLETNIENLNSGKEIAKYDVKSIINLVLSASLEIEEIGFKEGDTGVIEFSIDISNMNLNENIIKVNKSSIYNHFFANSILPIIIWQNMNKFSVLIGQEMDISSFSENFENNEKFFEIKRNKHSMKFAIHISRYNQYFFDQFRLEKNSHSIKK